MDICEYACPAAWSYTSVAIEVTGPPEFHDLAGCPDTFGNIVYVDIHKFFKHLVIDLMEEKLDTHSTIFGQVLELWDSFPPEFGFVGRSHAVYSRGKWGPVICSWPAAGRSDEFLTCQLTQALAQLSSKFRKTRFVVALQI